MALHHLKRNVFRRQPFTQIRRRFHRGLAFQIQMDAGMGAVPGQQFLVDEIAVRDFARSLLEIPVIFDI